MEVQAKDILMGGLFSIRGSTYRRHELINVDPCFVSAANPWEQHILGVDIIRHEIIALRPTTTVQVEV
jgi:hypothetical protein